MNRLSKATGPVAPSVAIVGIAMLVAGLATGCATVGTGSGSTASGADPVSFSWKSSNAVSGTMSATLSDGKIYRGQFFQITDDTRVDSVAPQGSEWHSRWGVKDGWHYWGNLPTPDFIEHNTGRVVAILGTPGGAHMRCKFQLAHPSDGMAGGGRGQCQMPDGRTIDATFPIA